MRLVFICGAMEAGRDGVGDYVRRLCAELIRQGHNPAVIALNDRYISDSISEIQESEGTSLSVLRISSKCPNEERYKKVKKFIDELNPDVVSLQFVPYSFHDKGIPYQMILHFKRLLRERKFKFHVMFHEMWLDTPIGIRQQMTAVLQKALISRMVRGLKPEAVNVSMPFNQSRLREIGVSSTVLRLFGNIYKEESSHFQIDDEWIKKMEGITLFYFGTPPKGSFLEELTDKLMAFCEVSGKKFNLFLACGTSQAKIRFVEMLRNKLDGLGCSVVDCGFLEISTISAIMSASTGGISRSNADLLGKSGGTIAMLEHGLPVWLPKWDGSDPVYLGFREELLFSDLHLMVASDGKQEYQPLIGQVTRDFLKILSSAQFNNV